MSRVVSNPFLDPRAADSLSGEDYVRCFSPFLVEYLPEMFAQENLILKGTIGCGKSMILRLLDPKVRLAYYKSGENFPIPEHTSNYIAAGINLSKSGILDILQRLPSSAPEEKRQQMNAVLVDYLNYWLVADFLKSIELMLKNQDCFSNIICKANNLEDFRSKLVERECWFGYLSDVQSFDDLRVRVKGRINTLRSWANWNDETLDSEILRTKTTIGEPLAAVVSCMKDSGLLKSDTVAFVRIDQVEELLHKDSHHIMVTELFRRSIYQAMARRDGRIFYRIGTRKYDNHSLNMLGGRELEESRDYTMKDFDSILRRKENRKYWLFKGFAENVFERRLKTVLGPGNGSASRKKSALRKLLGKSPTPHQLVEDIIADQRTPIESLLDLSELSPEWRKYINSVYVKKTPISRKVSSDYSIDALNAKLYLAWSHQNGGKRNAPPRYLTEPPPPLENEAPWTQWWEKERRKQAVLQLASTHKQRLMWWGVEDVLSLSSSNITLFLSLCREIWELWQRHARNDGESQQFVEISAEVQRVAIDNVSKRWHQNLAKQPGRPGGDVRLRFLDRVFADLRSRLKKDAPMRYPGANGFSLLDEDLEEFPELTRLIEECVAWGDLEKIPHTPKHSRDKLKGNRFKYFANTILAPHYQIFGAHTKEPLYLKPETLLDHAIFAKALACPQDLDRACPKSS